MQLFSVASGKLDPVPSATPTAVGLKETADLESWIRTQANIFDRHSLLWISRQERTSVDERADLLGLNEDELILAELKRGIVTKDAVAQALSYLAPHSKSDRSELMSLFIEHAAKTGSWALLDKPLDAEEAEALFESRVIEGLPLNQFRSVLLIGEDFDSETLQICNLLNESLGTNGTLTLECWKLHLFQHAGTYICGFDKLLPSKDVEDEIAFRREARKTGKYKRDANRIGLMKKFKWLTNAKIGKSPASNPGESYECRLFLSDSTHIQFSVRDTPFLRIPGSESIKIDDLLQAIPEIAKDGDGFLLTLPINDWLSESEKDAVAKRAVKAMELLVGIPKA